MFQPEPQAPYRRPIWRPDWEGLLIRQAPRKWAAPWTEFLLTLTLILCWACLMVRAWF